MKKLILLIIMTTILTLTAACSGEAPPEQPGSTAATPSAAAVSSGSGTPVAKSTSRPANTSIPAPTRPQRLQGLKKTPTPEPAPPSNPATATPVSPAATTVSSGSGTPVATQESQSRDEDISIKDLVPQNPQLNDTVLLQDIYPHADLDQFALDPTQPIPLPIIREKGELVRIETPSELTDWMSSPDPQWFFYENVKDHPYLHMFPKLQKDAHEEKPTYPQIQEEDIAFSFREYIASTEYDPTKEGGRINQFIYNPWFQPYFVGHGRTYSGHHIWFGNNSTKGVLAQAVTETMEEAKYPTARPMPTPWGEDRVKEWRLEDFLRSPAYAAGEKVDDDEWRYKNRDRDHVAPVTHWKFLHPQLPIIGVTSYNRVKLPLTVSSEDFSYKSLTDPNPNRSSQKLQMKEDAKHLEPRIRDMRPTTFAVSFVISFQNRWTSFEDPDRLMVRFQDDFETIAHMSASTRQQQKLQQEHSPNYWHPSDYMQHRLIGPVVLQVYESEVLQPGIYNAVPKVTHWEAPEFIMSDAFLEDLEARFTARIKERIATADEAGHTQASLMYAAQLEKGWWDVRGKNLVLPGNRPKLINYPLPGHIAISNAMDESRDSLPVPHPIYSRDW